MRESDTDSDRTVGLPFDIAAYKVLNTIISFHLGWGRVLWGWVSWFGVRLVSRGTSVQIRLGSPFSPKVVVSGHCLVTLSLTINETLKWLSSLLIYFNAGVILVVIV